MGTSSPSWAHLPLHGHIFHFIGTSSSSLAHLPLHWHLFPFIGTSSPSWVHLPFKDTWRGALAGHGLLPRELSRGFRRDTRGTLSEKCPIRFMPHLHTLSLRGETSKIDPRFAYADCLREDYREASARCLRVPTRTCKYQCFRFRGVNMSSPHKKVPSFQKKTWLMCVYMHVMQMNKLQFHCPILLGKKTCQAPHWAMCRGHALPFSGISWPRAKVWKSSLKGGKKDPSIMDTKTHPISLVKMPGNFYVHNPL